MCGWAWEAQPGGLTSARYWQSPARLEAHHRLPRQASFNGSGLILTYLVVLAIEA